LEGNHIPSKCSDFVDVLKQLMQMHSRSVVHGDIRLFNMLFLFSGGSTLIDFDFSGNGIYPTGYSIQLFDTVRHTNAKPGNLLQMDHDCFSMAAVMKLFSSKNEKWKDAVKTVEDGFLSEAISLLHNMHDILDIQNPNDLLSHKFATCGSPFDYKRITFKRPRRVLESQ
jgi:hypothetical protein